MNRDGLYGMPPFDTFGSGKTLAKGKIDLVLYTLSTFLIPAWLCRSSGEFGNRKQYAER